MNISFLENEYWYGGYTKLGIEMPISNKSKIEIDLSINETPNQMSTWFISSKGRYLYKDEGYCISFIEGEIICPDDIILKEGFDNLKGAYLDVRNNRNVKVNYCSEYINKIVYNTWIELTFNQNQKDVLEYANEIIRQGMPPGIIMIDDGWSDYYGKWRFNKEKFPEPKLMVDELHKMGFEVMLWICPFITPDTLEFRETRDKGYLVLDEEENIYIAKWWNGYSAVLDIGKKEASDWLNIQLNTLMELGIDGFKFDAGDSIYYPQNGNIYSRQWAEFSAKYKLNELRVCTNSYDLPLMQRLCDKNHSWNNNGVNSLIPDSLTASLLGYGYICPDMIGGGEYLNFNENIEDLDQDLFIRHCEAACLLPCMQFSAAPWRILTKDNFQKISSLINVRNRYLGELKAAFDEFCRSAEPIIKPLEYIFPNQNVEAVMDQFMLGNHILVAPIYEANVRERNVIIPRGKWKNELTSEEFETDRTISVSIYSNKGELIVLRLL